MTDTTTTYVPSQEYVDLLRRRREAAERLGVTREIRAAVIRSKSWIPSTGPNEFVDRNPDPHETRFSVRGAPH
jgi:hypothetical protein